MDSETADNFLYIVNTVRDYHQGRYYTPWIGLLKIKLEFMFMKHYAPIMGGGGGGGGDQGRCERRSKVFVKILFFWGGGGGGGGGVGSGGGRGGGVMVDVNREVKFL